MKKILLLFSLIIFLTGCTFTAKPTITQDEINLISKRVGESKLIILDIYFSGCRSCKHIEPIIKKLEEKYASNKEIIILKYDFSSPTTTANSLAIAKSIGLEELYKAQKYSGVVLFISSKTKQTVDELVGETSEDVYERAITKNLKRVGNI